MHQDNNEPTDTLTLEQAATIFYSLMEQAIKKTGCKKA